MNCIKCDVIIDASNDSDEHLIANAIGGRLKIPGIICRTCNGNTGEKWDSVLATLLHPLSVLFGIKRQRGEVPPLEVVTVSGDRLFIRSDGSLHPAPTAPTLYEEGGQQWLQVTSPTMADARKTLETLKERRYPKMDVEKELAAAQVQQKFDNVIKFDLTFSDENARRAAVKSAFVLAVHSGADACACPGVLSYLKGSDASPPYGFFFERDPITNRPAKTPLHCVAVSSRGNQGQLLGYVEYFGIHRMVVCLAHQYDGADIHCCYAVNPITGEQLQLEFTIGLSREDVARCYRGECVPKGVPEAAFHEVMPLAMEVNRKRAWQDAVNRAIKHGLDNCGAVKDEMLTAQHASKIAELATQRLLPFLMRQLDARENSMRPPQGPSES
jgi:hypothetical protein